MAAIVILGYLAWAIVDHTLVPVFFSRTPNYGPYGPVGWPPAHRSSKTCDLHSHFDPGGFDTGPISGETVEAGVEALPRFPGTTYGDAAPGAVAGLASRGVAYLRSQPASDEMHISFGGKLFCQPATAYLLFSTTSNVDSFTGWLDRAMVRVGWTKVGQIPANGDAQGHGDRVYRRGHREWASVDFAYTSNGLVERLPDGLYHGQMSYSIAPYPCNGDEGCGDQALVFPSAE
jgi:hypothetical protein